MNRILLILLIVLVACSAPKSSDPEIAKLQGQAENVEIIRDDYGVPHIYGKTDADAVFGLLYAQCEDDFPRVERNFAWAIGRLAETEGRSAVFSDLRARLFMTQEEAVENYESSPEWMQKLCNAWADGINYYLYMHPEVKPKVITKFEPWMTMYFTEGSIGGDIERVSTRKIEEFYSNGGLVADASAAELPDYMVEPKGSNGLAIAGDLTASGNAMLLINPHTSFYFRGEVHVVSEEGLNAYGAVTWGQFFVYQGFNENTGWMHTSTYTDVIDEFVEDVSEKEDGSFVYQYGDEERAVESTSVFIKYKDGNIMRKTAFPVYRTHHGPITHKIDDKWVATALMWEPVKALEQSYTRTKKKNHAEFREMMDIRTNSSNNTVFADSEGNIAYYHGNFVPRRDVQFDYTKPVDGSNPATDWQGLHPVEEAITVFNPPNGWIQNCNSTPFTSAAEYSPKKEDYPRYMSRIPENFRGVHAIDLLRKAKGLTLDGLIDIAYDPYLPAFAEVVPGLINAYDNSPKDATLSGAIDVLRNWDMKTSKESVGMSLAHFYGMALYGNAEIPDELIGLDRFNYFGTGLPESERLEIFAKAVAELSEKFGDWNTPWGEISRFQRLDGAIDLQFDDDKPSIAVGLTTSRWGALAAYGMRGNQDVKKIYGTRGNSFVAAVEFGERLSAKTLLAGGQSGDPSSPHFYDQAQRYADGEFKDVAFYRDDVEARAEETYKPGKR
ncbi:MAG: acylase [Cyclobacteriaceae bacterium]